MVKRIAKVVGNKIKHIKSTVFDEILLVRVSTFLAFPSIVDEISLLLSTVVCFLNNDFGSGSSVARQYNDKTHAY